MSFIAGNFSKINERIERAAAGRPVRLIAVSKTFPADRVREAFTAGIRTFGENRIQEAAPKIQSVHDLPIEWHFIGHLQSNKARDAVRHFSFIQSIDSIKLLKQVEKEAAGVQKQMEALFEINIGEEENKHGFLERDLAGALEAAHSLQWCRVRGLMIIPPFLEDAEQIRPYFKALRRLQQSFVGKYPGLIELSMGMSHDFEIAIQEGATMVRIGTALFGDRPSLHSS